MSRFLRISNTVIHVPSLANVSMKTNCFGSPSLCLYYHTQETQTLNCGKYEECERQMMRIKAAMKKVETALDEIPLVESEPVESKMIDMTVQTNSSSEIDS
jgi:hypothetical protein